MARKRNNSMDKSTRVRSKATVAKSIGGKANPYSDVPPPTAEERNAARLGLIPKITNPRPDGTVDPLGVRDDGTIDGRGGKSPRTLAARNATAKEIGRMDNMKRRLEEEKNLQKVNRGGKGGSSGDFDDGSHVILLSGDSFQVFGDFKAKWAVKFPNSITNDTLANSGEKLVPTISPDVVQELITTQTYPYNTVVLAGGINDTTAIPYDVTVDQMKQAFLNSLDACNAEGIDNVILYNIATAEAALDINWENYQSGTNWEIANTDTGGQIDPLILGTAYTNAREYNDWTLAYARAVGVKVADYNLVPFTTADGDYHFADGYGSGSNHPTDLGAQYMVDTAAPLVVSPSTFNQRVYDSLKSRPSPELLTPEDIERIGNVVSGFSQGDWDSLVDIWLFDQQGLNNAYTGLKSASLLVQKTTAPTYVTGGLEFAPGVYLGVRESDGVTPIKPIDLGLTASAGIVCLARSLLENVGMFGARDFTQSQFYLQSRVDTQTSWYGHTGGGNLKSTSVFPDLYGKVIESHTTPSVANPLTNSQSTIFVDGVLDAAGEVAYLNNRAMADWEMTFNSVSLQGVDDTVNSTNSYGLFYITDGTNSPIATASALNSRFVLNLAQMAAALVLEGWAASVVNRKLVVGLDSISKENLVARNFTGLIAALINDIEAELTAQGF